MRVGFVGTRGIPARYGGFETCAEEVSVRLAGRGHEVTVYVRRKPDAPSYRGVELVYAPSVKLRWAETLSSSYWSVRDAAKRDFKAVILFNPANAPVLLMLRRSRIPVATHMDGLEWKRSKWGRVARRYLKWAARHAATRSDLVISDSQAIQSMYSDWLSVESRFIPYGTGVHLPTKPLEGLNVSPGAYHLVVARLEPENHVDLIVEAYEQSGCKLPLLVVGDVDYRGSYQKAVLARRSDAVHFFGWIWDQELLDALYAGAACYLHGHSVGGTNPSLLRAVGAGTPVLGYDCVFNREVLQDDGSFFQDRGQLAGLLRDVETNSETYRERANRAAQRVRRLYDWDLVTDAYEALLRDLVDG